MMQKGEDNMREKIMALDDRTAKNILETFAGSFLRSGDYETEFSRELAGALKDSFGIEAPAAVASEGDLAREALLVLAQDPEMGSRVSVLIDRPPEKFLGVGTSIGVLAAVMVVLQTQVKFKRDKDGKWEILIDKKAAEDSVLKPLIAKLLSFLPLGGGGD
jgi:hypothetical protein